MPIERLSLTSVRTSIDTAINNLVNTTQYNTLLDELRRGNTAAATANAFTYLGLTIGSTLTEVYNTIINAGSTNTENYQKAINSVVFGENVTNENRTLQYTDFPTGLTNIQAIANAVEDIDDILDITNVDTNFDTLAEIVTQIISENNSFDQWVAKKYEKASIITGSSSFNLSNANIGYTNITLNNITLPDNYTECYVKIIPSATCNGNLGEVRVNHFLAVAPNSNLLTISVYCSGTTTATFDYLVMFY